MADSLNQVTQQTALQEVEQKYNNRLLKASLESFRLKHQVQMAGMIFILIILALIVVLVGYAWTRRYKKVREERALLKQELDNLHQVYDDLSNRFLQVRQMLDCSNERESKVSKAIEERLSGLHQLVEKLPAIKPANFVREFKGTWPWIQTRNMHSMTCNTSSIRNISESSIILKPDTRI